MQTASRTNRTAGILTGFAVAAITASVIVTWDLTTGVAREPVQVAIRPADAVAPLAGAVFAQAPAGATLSGTILYDGAPPKRAALDTSSKDPEVCSLMPVLAEDLVVNPDNKGIANVFVYLAKVPDGVKVPKAPADPLVFDQKGCQFLPHCMTVQVGSNLLVKSGDPVPHNTHVITVRNEGFNQVIPANNRNGVALKYTKGERLPTEVKCDFHPWMKAYHLILEHPWMAVTDADGKFSIAGLPGGKHTFIIWQEKAGYLNRTYEVELKADEKKDVKLPFKPEKFTQ